MDASIKPIESKKPIIIGKRDSHLCKVIPLITQKEIDLLKLCVRIVNQKLLS